MRVHPVTLPANRQQILTGYALRSNPHNRLIAHIMAFAGAGDNGVNVSLISSGSQPWASATFIGARHMLTLRLSGNDAHIQGQRFTALLPEAEFVLPGQIVADITLDSCTYGMDPVGEPFTLIRIAALTIEDR